ncbi:hypothetical protein ONZ45_g17539 [Pleurotus djamor]|nr:hypothetical protein ONZ45_g17539 [Pleurotus djamor]
MKFTFGFIAAVLCASEVLALPTGYEGQLHKRTKPKVQTVTVYACPPTSTVADSTSSVPVYTPPPPSSRDHYGCSPSPRNDRSSSSCHYPSSPSQQ